MNYAVKNFWKPWLGISLFASKKNINYQVKCTLNLLNSNQTLFYNSYCTRKSWRFLFARKWWTNCKQNFKNYENHSSVSKVKSNQNETLNFDFPTGKVEDINKIITSY